MELESLYAPNLCYTFVMGIDDGRDPRLSRRIRKRIWLYFGTAVAFVLVGSDSCG